jgi:hypothetical protein
VDCTAPSVTITAGVPHAAEAVADPKAALISEAEGLQPRVGIAPVIIIVGGLGALVHVTVLTTVAVLPQASKAVNVLVCEALHDVVDIAPSLDVMVGLPQASVADAVPRAAVISEAEGLHPRVTGEYVPVNVGGVRSEVQLTVLDTVAVLPQASVAINVLTCERRQPLLVIAPSTEVTVGVPHPSLADAEPSEVLISVGLQPSVTSAYVPVNAGGVISEVQLTVLDTVAVLPQASVAVNVLTCER